MFTCTNCGNPKAYGYRCGYSDFGKWEECDGCSSQKFTAQPDVYLGSKGGIQTDPNICDKQGNEIPFSCKRTKLAAMKEAGVRQSSLAEKQHGARNDEWKSKTRKTV
jgi:hypothetical protein